MYASRRYLREKYDKIKWDIEKVLDIYNDTDDKISEDNINRVKNNLRNNFEAISKELNL